MSSKIQEADIIVVPNGTRVDQHLFEAKDKSGYDVTNVEGFQVTFQGYLFQKIDQLKGITDENVENITNNKPEWSRRSLSDRFPVSLFFGKKEGDIVVLKYLSKDGETITIHAKLNNLSYMYREQGPFQEALYDALSTFGGCVSQDYYDPPLKQRTQREMIHVAHELYARSLKMKIKEPHEFRFSSSYIEQCMKDAQLKPTLATIEKMSAFVGVMNGEVETKPSNQIEQTKQEEGMKLAHQFTEMVMKDEMNKLMS